MSAASDDPETRWPAIHWREPINVSSHSGNIGIGCRLCIARYGLSNKYSDIASCGYLFRDRSDFDKHMTEKHSG